MSAGRNQSFRDPDFGEQDHQQQDHDLPLSAIPSIPNQRGSLREPRPVATYVIAAAALFAIIVAISFIAAPHLRMPEAAATIAATRSDLDATPPVAVPTQPFVQAASAVRPPSQQAQSNVSTAPPLVETAPERPPSEEAGTPERLVGRQANVSPPSAEARPTPSTVVSAAQPDAASVVESNSRVLALRSDLGAREKALAQALSGLEGEKRARRDAEKKLEKAVAEQASVSKEAARARDLQEQLKHISTERDRAVQEGESRAATLSQQLAATEAKLAAAADRESKARLALEARSSRHEQALEGENTAVRKLLAQLEESKAQVEKERTARRDAETRLKAAQAVNSTPSGPASVESSASTVAASGPRKAAKAPASVSETTPPERVSTVAPRYPDDLRQARIGGRVLLRLRVDMWGNVEEVEVIETPHARLSAAAERAAREWKYTPARQDGIRVATWITEAVDFRM